MKPNFDYHAISIMVGFYRKHHKVPEDREVEAAAKQAKRGNEEGAIQLLDWSRHCFYVKSERERVVMEKVFGYVKELLYPDNI